MSTSAALCVILLLALAGCSPYPLCRGDRDFCAVRFANPEECGTERSYPGGGWVVGNPPMPTVWRDPHDGCWLGVSGDAPDGWSNGHDAWCNQSLLDNPGLCSN
jgi:hypothetical protein